MRRVRVVAAVAGIAIATLAACAPPPEGAESGNPTDLAAIVSGSASAIDPFAPVAIDPSVPSASAPVGAVLEFEVPEDQTLTTTISVDKADVVEITPAAEDSGVVYPASGTTLAPGTAVITFTPKSGPPTSVTLTVT